MIQYMLGKPESKAHLDSVRQIHLLHKVQMSRSNVQCTGQDSQVMAGVSHYYTDHGVVSQGDMRVMQ